MEQNEIVEGTSTEIKDPRAVLSALERAKAEAKKFRLEKEALENDTMSYKAKLDNLQQRVVKNELIEKLKEMGIPSGNRLLKYINMNEIQFDDDFNITGLETQIDALKTDLPELFDPKMIVAGKADTGVASTADIELSASEIQAKKILGK